MQGKTGLTSFHEPMQESGSRRSNEKDARQGLPVGSACSPGLRFDTQTHGSRIFFGPP